MKWVRCGVAGSVLACWVLLTRVVLGDEESRKPQVPELKVEKYTLPNGLTVLLHEDHKTPVAAVDVFYKVGSKDERAGRTGFAHLFEHMMFLGSKHHDEDFSRPLERLGAEVNATTEEDRTEYYERVPGNALERALWLEADRMGFLLPAMTQEKLDKERDVVKNERRETVDNAPYGQADEAMREALYPEGHPYRHSVIGSMVDLSAAGLADVSTFLRTFYVPDNAILCVAGDFEPEQARRWIARCFGPLPRGPRVTPPKPDVPGLSAPKHIKLTDAVSLPRAQLIWPTVPAGHPDEPALDVLAAVLGGLDKENRLFRELMYDRQLAASVSASHPTQVLAGTFEVELYAHPDQSLDELVTIADAQIDRLKRDGPTAMEVRKARNQRESELIMGLQSVIRKAAVFNEYEAVLGDPQAYRSELTKVFAVTPEDVRRVANTYLGANRIELDITPGDPMPRPPQADAAVAKPNPTPAPAAVDVKDDFDRSAMPELGPTPRYQPPRFERRRLSNGLELRVIERHELPIVTVDLVVKSGETLAPIGKEGLATLAASLLEEGTKTRTSLQLAGELSEIGATLAAGASLESTTVSLTTLTRHLEHALDLYADVVKNPSFPDKELDRLKLERLSHLKARTDDPEQTAAAVFPRLIYGLDHPYGRPDLGTPASIGSIIREDVVAFHRRIMVPSNAVLVVVGDVRPDAIAAALEARLSTWASGPVPPSPSLALMPTPPRARTFYLIDKPGAAQSVLTIGRIGASRKSADYSALVVLNAILGGQFESRLNANLRVDKGYSYGVNSSFSFDRGPGPFEAGGTVETTVTKKSLVEMFKELTDLSGSRPITDAELAFAKERIVLGFPSRFETTFGVAGQLATLIADELPDDELDRYQSRVEALTKADVDRVARQYITPETMTILVVGDRAKVEGPLKSLPFVKAIRRLDVEGNPLPDTGAGEHPRNMATTITSAELQARLLRAGHRPPEGEWAACATDVWPTPETIVTVALGRDPTLMPTYRRCYFVCLLKSEKDPVPALRDDPAFALPEPFRDLRAEPSRSPFLGGPIRWLFRRLVRLDRILLWPARQNPESSEPFAKAELRDRIPVLFEGLPAGPVELSEIGAVVLDLSQPTDCRLLDQVANDVTEDFNDFLVSDLRCREVYRLHHHEKIEASIPDEESRREVLDDLASLSSMIEDCSGYVSDWDDEDDE